VIFARSTETNDIMARKGETIAVKEIFVHGLGIGDIGKVVLEDRTLLGDEGVVVAVLKINKNKNIIGKPEMTSRGFVFQQKFGEVLESAGQELQKTFKGKNLIDNQNTKKQATQFLEKYFFEKTRRHPMVLPVIVEI